MQRVEEEKGAECETAFPVNAKALAQARVARKVAAIFIFVRFGFLFRMYNN
jgi:hypothetical protein